MLLWFVSFRRKNKRSWILDVFYPHRNPPKSCDECRACSRSSCPFSSRYAHLVADFACKFNTGVSGDYACDSQNIIFKKATKFFWSEGTTNVYVNRQHLATKKRVFSQQRNGGPTFCGCNRKISHISPSLYTTPHQSLLIWSAPCLTWSLRPLAFMVCSFIFCVSHHIWPFHIYDPLEPEDQRVVHIRGGCPEVCLSLKWYCLFLCLG